MYYVGARNQVRRLWEYSRKSPDLQDIPDEVLDLMKDSALEALDKMELAEQNGYPVDSGTTSNYPYPTVDKYPYEKDRK